MMNRGVGREGGGGGSGGGKVMGKVEETKEENMNNNEVGYKETTHTDRAITVLS
jgi:hypothetical protein